jgi:hypothetical protein
MAGLWMAGLLTAAQGRRHKLRVPAGRIASNVRG